MARDSWTDHRLDDLNQRVANLDHRTEAGFGEIRAELRVMRTETNAQFAAQNRMMLQLFAGLIVAVIIGFLGVIATILTQV